MTRLRKKLAHRTRRAWASVRAYSLRKLRRDAVAGVSVSVVAIPQSIAYALIAGVPPEYGLYTLVIQSLLGSVLNASSFLSVGPVNTQSLLIASVVTHVMGRVAPLPSGERAELYLLLVIGLAILKGVIQLILAAARMGRLVKYISQSVVVGFTAGAGVLIAVAQIPNFLSIDLGDTPRRLPGLFGTLEQILHHVAEINPRSAILGTATLLLIVGLSRISKRIPAPLVAVSVAGVVVWLCGWTGGQLLLVNPLPLHWPVLGVPHLSIVQWEALLGGAVALSVLGILETYSIGKALAIRTGQRVDFNRELAGQGGINLISGLFSCIPGSASFSRSALNVYTGAASRVSGACNGLFTACVMVFFAPAARYVPLSALAAVLFIIAYHLIDRRYLRDVLRADPADAAVCLVTLGATLTVPLQYAIFIGVFLNLAFYLRQASRLQLMHMVPTDAGPFVEKPVAQPPSGPQDVVFLQLEGDLFFGIADELQDRLTDLAAAGVRVVIFRLKRTHTIDATVLKVLDQFTQDLQSRRGHVILCGVRPELMAKLRAWGLADRIGPENIFEARSGIFASAKQAIARAAELTGGTADE